MQNTAFHQRWLIEVSKNDEDELCDWLSLMGCTAIYRDVEPSCTLYAYFPPNHQLPNADSLKRFETVRLLQSENFADDDWLARSRDGFDSIDIGRTLRINPVWKADKISTERTSIIVNPGLAFGTGRHETTRLCMCMLEDMAKQGTLLGPVLDIGTGTGILALTAWLLGAKKITAFDCDPDCEPVINDFLALNTNLIGSNKPFNYFIGTIDDPAINSQYNTVIANIFLETIQTILPRIAQISTPGGLLVASGILADNKDEALISLVINKFNPIRITQDGNWIAILARYCHEQS
jgi:ribosomal protein L11 methyltransferase